MGTCNAAGATVIGGAVGVGDGAAEEVGVTSGTAPGVAGGDDDAVGKGEYVGPGAGGGGDC
jgi:hypothetical protein